MMDTSRRLDSFTDAAFAFAVTLLVIDRTAAPTSSTELFASLAGLPAFAVGFALIGMFWFTHVRWRRYRGEGGAAAVLLTFALIFFVLIYIRPLQAVAGTLGSLLGAPGSRFEGYLGGLFAVYGAGFLAMSAVISCLFLDAHRNPDLSAEDRHVLGGEIGTWLIMTLTGLASLCLSLSETTERLAPWAYATLPATIGLFWLMRGRSPGPGATPD